MPIFIFCFGILFSKMPFENLMLFFVYPNKCQTLWYETILHNKQNNKKYLSPPFFSSICTIGHNLGVTKAKKMRFCPPKKTTEFLSEKTEASSRDVLLSTGKKWKIERETKVVIQSGLRLKLAFEVFWKFSCLFWHPLLSLSNAGVKRKKFCHPQMIQNFIDWASRSKGVRDALTVQKLLHRKCSLFPLQMCQWKLLQ